MKNERLLSVDFFRGITMFLLIGEFTNMFSFMTDPFFQGTIVDALGTQFHHHPWHGLRFWDLIQPFFMFIVGVAIPLSSQKREARGDSKSKLIKHAFGRAGMLLLLGWALYCIGPGKITFHFQNVLAQLSVTYLVAFLLRNTKVWVQLTVSFSVLLLSEILYRTFGVEGFNQPFTPDHNFGAWVDLLISGDLSGGHWVSFNAVPTISHTVWGVLIGKLLISKQSQRQKLSLMLILAFAGIAGGYLLDTLTPIIKRISTSSFVILSGAYSVLVMAISYWLIDVKGYHWGTKMFAIVGMNPLFIYLFAHVGGADLIYYIFKPFAYFLMSWTNEIYGMLLTSALSWAFLWYLCYWLYKRNIFIRI